MPDDYVSALFIRRSVKNGIYKYLVKFEMAGLTGLEPATSGVTERRSYQLQKYTFNQNSKKTLLMLLKLKIGKFAALPTQHKYQFHIRWSIAVLYA